MGPLQDHAPAHYLVAVSDRLREHFGEGSLRSIMRWNGHRVRSTSLTPCDLFLFGHLKNMMFTYPPRDMDDLNGLIRHEVGVLLNKVTPPYLH